MAATSTPPSDDVALAEIREFAYDLGQTPGRNQIMERFGWGASRSTRLLNLYKEQSEADRSADYQTETVQSPGPVQPTSPPVQPEAVVRTGQAGPAPADRSDGPVQKKQSPAVRPDGPARFPQPSLPPVQAEQTAAPGPTEEVQADSLPTAPIPDQTGPAVRPEPEGPQANTQSSAGPVGQSWEEVRSAVDSLDSPEPQTTTVQSDGPVRSGRPYGLIAAVMLISLSAFVAVWGGWVGLGRMVGFGPVNLLPGIGDGLVVDLAIALPLGIEAYAAAALWVAVGGLVRGKGRWFAGLSAGIALGLGAFGQATYHLLEVQGITVAPDWVIVFVSVLPVVVLGAAGVLLHLVLEERKRR